MPTALGTKAIMGVKKQTVYATPLAVSSTGDKVPLLSEGIEFDYTDVLHEYLFGNAGIPGRQRVFEPVSGSIECEIPYTEKNGTEFVSASVLIALAMGTATWDAAQTSNRITLLDDLNVFGTIAVDKGHHATKVWEITGAMVNSMTLSGSAEESLKGSFDIIAYDMAIDNSTNTVSLLAGMPNDVPTLVLFKDFTFRIGDQAGALGDGDRVNLSAFSLSLNNNLSPPEQSTIETGHTDQKQTLQPVRNGFREVTLEITIPRYDADTFIDFLTNDTNLQADLLGTHPSAGGTEFDIIMPNLKVESISAPIAGAGLVVQTVTLRCFRRNSASDMTFSDGSTTDTGELWIETDDERTGVIF